MALDSQIIKEGTKMDMPGSPLEFNVQKITDLPQFSYGELITLTEISLTQKQMADRTIQKIRSAVMSWMTFWNLNAKNKIGREMNEFTAHLQIFLAAKNKSGQKEGSLRSLKSRIDLVNRIYVEWVTDRYLPQSFSAALTTLIEQSKEDYKSVARKALGNKDFATKIHNWANGDNLPRIDSLSAIIALEKHFGIPEGTLQKRLPTKLFGEKGPRGKGWSKSVFGERQATLMKDEFRHLKWSKELVDEFEELRQSKLGAVFISENGEDLSNTKLWRVDETGECPTADSWRKYLNGYFGFLVNRAAGSLKMSERNLTLALLVDKARIHAWIEFTKERAGGIYNGSTEQQIHIIRTLVRPHTGFLWANPSFGQRLFPIIEAENWRQRCEDIWIFLGKFNSNIKKHVGFKKTRDPVQVLREVLDRQHPIHVLFDVLDEHNKEKPLDHQRSTKHAKWFRDHLLLEILTNCPLRMRTLARMTYRDDNNGHLYRRDDGSWWIRYNPNEFKNERGAAATPFNVPLRNEIWHLIETYLNTYRPLLLATYGDQLDGIGGDVFLHNAKLNAYKKYGPPRKLGAKAKSLSETIRYLTRTYLNISLGGHSYRHIIATDWIRNHPDGYVIAADILHDKIETVLREYAHLRREEGMAAYNQYLAVIHNDWEDKNKK